MQIKSALFDVTEMSNGNVRKIEGRERRVTDVGEEEEDQRIRE